MNTRTRTASSKSEQREPRARLTLEKAQAKLDFLRNTSGPDKLRSSSPRSRRPDRRSWPSRPAGNSKSPGSRNCKRPRRVKIARFTSSAC